MSGESHISCLFLMLSSGDRPSLIIYYEVFLMKKMINWVNKKHRREVIRMAEKQTAGRDNLGEFAPKFAELNDDVLFGEVWSRERELNLHDRSMITVSALITKGAFAQLPAHMKLAKEHGITKDEIVEVITQLAFYVGWPNAWSAFNIAKDIWKN